MLGQLEKYKETGVSLILLGLCIKTPWEMPLASLVSALAL